MLLLTPVLFELSVSMAGALLPSLIMVAVTPILAELIASRIPCKELLLESMVTVFTPCPLVVKVASVYFPLAASSLPPAILPKSNVSFVGVPVPMLLLSLAWPVTASF